MPLLAKLHLVFGIYQANPALFYAGLSKGLVIGHTAYPSIDFNNGAVSQALGRRAALDVFGGVMPWWNPYEGVGTPLVGEMQSAALFPGTWLLALPGGQLAMQLILQMVAGLFTYLTLRRLGAAALAAGFAGVFFEFNGTFNWLQNAVMNPIGFLPMMLFGVEAVRAGAGAGWRWVAAGLALSLYAGFPEVAYIDGLLAGAWALARLPGRFAASPSFLFRLAAGAAVGLLLAAPLLVAFLDYLPHASLIMHQGGFFSHIHMQPRYLLNLALPYVLGQIWGTPDIDNMAGLWALTGGYFGIGSIVLALLGVLGSRLRGLRLMLLAWVLVCGVLIFGGPLAFLLRAIPGLGNASFYRYADPSMAMALATLGGLALDDLLNGEHAAMTRRYWLAVIGAAILLGVAVLAARHVLAVDRARLWLFLSFAIAAAIFAALLAIGRRQRGRAAALGLLVAAELLFNFVLPSFNYSRNEHMALGGVAYLKAHLGLQRLYSMSVIQPNYGSYLGIAQINDCDLPLPKDWLAYRQRHLDPDASVLMFNGEARLGAGRPKAAEALRRNLAKFEGVGVAYVAALPGGKPFNNPAPPLVYADRAMDIYKLPDPRPYMSAPGCTVVPAGRLAARLSCAAPVMLTRLELTMPGWRAWVNGKPAPVTTVDEIFQAVPVPAGASDVRFGFRPPHMGFGYAAFLLGIAAMMLRLQHFQRLGLAWRRKGGIERGEILRR